MKYYLRGTQQPTPNNIGLYLNAMQQTGLCQAEEYGWHLEFIRRPPFHDAQPVIVNGTNKQIGFLRNDGTIDITTPFPLRH
jgi:hypothetical protein